MLTRFAVLCGFWLLLSPVVGAQNSAEQLKIDSLERLLPGYTDRDTARVSALNRLSALYEDADLEKSHLYAEQALAAALKAAYPLGEAWAHTYLGRNLARRGNYSAALEHSLTAERLFERYGTPFNRASAAYQIGVLYDMMGQNERAIDVYKQFITLVQGLGRVDREAGAWGNLGAAYDMSGQDSLSLDAYRKALRLYQQLGNKEGMAWVAANMARLLSGLKQYQESLELVQTYLPMSAEEGDVMVEGMLNGTAGIVYHDLAKQAPPGAQRQAYATQAMRYLERAREMNEASRHLQELADDYRYLSQTQSLLGADREALRLLLKYNELCDSIQANKSREAIEEVETHDAVLRKEHELQVQELKSKQQQVLLWLLGAGLLGLVFWLALLFRLRQRSERLLLNILPPQIARRLKSGENPLADQFSGVSVVFVDIVGFTQLAARTDPDELVRWLNDLFVQFDEVCRRQGLEKIKTIGDCYMAVAGIPEPQNDHADRLLRFALDLLVLVRDYTTPDGEVLQVRIGCDSGSAVAGVIGNYKFSYDLWGDTVNTAARMESGGVPGKIHCTDRFRTALITPPADAQFQSRGTLEVKGKGQMQTFLIDRFDDSCESGV